MRTALAVGAAAVLGCCALLRYHRQRRRAASLRDAIERLSAASAADDAGPPAAEKLLALLAGTSPELDLAEIAAALDAADPLVSLRGQFHIPPGEAYFAGNSLGLEPKGTSTLVRTELDKWAGRGVMGHFEGELPWATCEDALPRLLAPLVGADDAELEVGAMNSLTVNLHLLMAAFYRPSAGRAAILIEAGAFPSDRYAVGSQIAHHGFDPSAEMIEVAPRASDGLLHTADILATIDAHRERLALVLLGGVNYLTGQVLDMGALAQHMASLNDAARATKRPPIPFGLDLAHAIGNVPLRLHAWRVDFAAWCSYKYLNSGAGCLAGLFVHADHADDSATYPRLSGWWSVPFAKRFEMAHAYDEARGARAFGVSNVNPLMVACVLASLRVFEAAGGIAPLRAKSLLLTGFLEALLRHRGLLVEDGAAPRVPPGRKAVLQLVTPHAPQRRGCQLSLRVCPGEAGGQGASSAFTMRALEQALRDRGTVGDAREPDILRISPAPLYNSFGDVLRAVDALESALAV